MLRSDEVNKEMGKIAENYTNWLRASNLTNDIFITNRYIDDFKIIMDKDDAQYTVIRIGKEREGLFQQIGEQILYMKNDLGAFQDAALLLLYMAQKLDYANKSAPKFEQRGSYFYDVVSEFLKGTEEYKKIQENSSP